MSASRPWTLQDKVVLLTGGSRGIGRSLAVALAREGAKVAVAAKTIEPNPRLPGTLGETVEAIEAVGGQGLAIRMDVRDDAAISAGVAATVERFGGLHIVIHNAGALWWKPVADTPARRFDLVMDVNARAAHLLCHHALPHLKAAGGGHVLTMSPPLMPHAVAWKSAYMISKFGMTITAMGVAEEHRADGIGANALWPETLVGTAATINYQIGNARHWYKPELVADAAVAILRRPPLEQTGQALLCLEVLRAAGVTDFVPYRFDPEHEPPILDELSKLPRVGGKETSDGQI